MLVPVTDIDPPAENVRRIAASLDDDEQLSRSISALGVLSPLLVIAQTATPPDAQRYRIVDGERRWRLARAVGVRLIEVIEAPRADEKWTSAAAAAANMCRSEMHPVDRWRIMARLQAQGYTLAAASAALGLPERAGKRLDRLSRLHPDVLAYLERGDWPNDRDLGVIASAPPAAQAAALADKQSRHADGPNKGCVTWWKVSQALNTTRIPASRAIFARDADTPLARAVTWCEDLFAEPGAGEEWYTADAPAFLAAQHEALAQKIAAPPKGIKYATAKLDQYGRAKPPKGWQIEEHVDPDKPKRGRMVLFAIEEKGFRAGMLLRFVAKPKAGTKPAPEDETAPKGKATTKTARPAVLPDEPPEDDVAGADEATDAPPPPLAPEPPAGITKAGLSMIAAAKTAALRARLDGPLTAAQALAGLLLLLTAPNVIVQGAEEDVRDLRERLVAPDGSLDSHLGTAELIGVAQDALRRCLSVAGPDVAYPRTDSGEVAEWLGHALDAADHLPRLDTAEFLATVSGDVLRAIATEHGHKPATKVAALRQQLIGHLPDWRPAAAQFGAPGPKPRKEGA